MPYPTEDTYKPKKILCERAGCDKKATRILHWKNCKRAVQFYCDHDAEAALAVVHI